MEFEKEAVRLISQGYEWTCPNCDTLNMELTYGTYVDCFECCKRYEVSKHDHKFEHEY